MYQQIRPSNFSSMPLVVKNLLIINGLCFLAYAVLESRGISNMNRTFGLYYPESSYFRPFQFITHVFMHADVSHLFSNMFALWMFGTSLENYWGPKRFFIYYFATAFGAAALYLGINAIEIQEVKGLVAAFNMNPGYESFFNMVQSDHFFANDSEMTNFLLAWKEHPADPSFIASAKEFAEYLPLRKMNIPMVGASGAVFGVLLGFGMLFPNAQVMIFPLPAKYLVMLYGGMELYQGLANNPSDNVAHFAHLGGMLFGFILIKFWNKTNRQHFY